MLRRYFLWGLSQNQHKKPGLSLLFVLSLIQATQMEPVAGGRLAGGRCWVSDSTHRWTMNGSASFAHD
jgi:hypothetical protein